MDPSFASLYRELHESHWWFRDRQHYVLSHLRRFAAARPKGSILDIGCGDGLLLEELEEFGQPEGLEPDATIVSEERRKKWTIHLCPFDKRFDPGKRFAVILMLDVLEHVEDPKGVLRHIADLLEPGGLLISTVPASRLLWTNHDDLNRHRTRYSAGELKAEIRESELELLTCQYFFHWLAPIKLLVRLAEKLTGAGPKPPRLPHPIPNGIFHLFTRLEQVTWGKLGLPFGTSILAVAEKTTLAGEKRAIEP